MPWGQPKKPKQNRKGAAFTLPLHTPPIPLPPLIRAALFLRQGWVACLRPGEETVLSFICCSEKQDHGESSHHGSEVTKPISTHEDTGLIPGPFMG